MRDPGLVQRAERAALALERAWEQWRSQRGLGAEKPTPVSSYVGYSLEEPWGQPRVVFGLGAEEAEMLAAVLNGYDYIGPVHADLTDWRTAAEDQLADLAAAPVEAAAEAEAEVAVAVEQVTASDGHPPVGQERADREPADEQARPHSQLGEPLIAAHGPRGEHDTIPPEVVPLEELVPLPAPNTDGGKFDVSAQRAAAPPVVSRLSRPRRSQRSGRETEAWAQEQEHQKSAAADTPV